MRGVLLSSGCHWLAAESLSHYRRCVITQGEPRNFGTPPLYNPKCQHCPSQRPRGDVRTPLWVKTQCEEIPKAEKTTRGPFKSTLPRCCAKRERKRGRERERALINNNTALRSRFYRIQFRAAASARKRWAHVSHIEPDFFLFVLFVFFSYGINTGSRRWVLFLFIYFFWSGRKAVCYSE